MRSMSAQPTEETIVAVALGTNLGDREGNLIAAREALSHLPRCRAFHYSGLYETDAVDCAEPHPFLNAVVTFRTAVAPLALLSRLQQIEAHAGRQRPYPNAPRTLDLDLLFYGDRLIDTPRLTIPHPRLEQRRFVLVPLADCVGPDWRHPRTGAPLQRLLARSLDTEGDTVRSWRHPQWATTPA